MKPLANRAPHVRHEIGHVSRRSFIKGAAAAGLLAGIGGVVPAYARPGRNGYLGGSSIDLSIGEQEIEIGGRRAAAIAINGTVPGPLLRLREGQDVVIRVTNQLANESTSIHWHGLILPFRMDGVPGVSYPGIGVGETFTYRFPVRQNGTYWYHSHTAAQEQLGVVWAVDHRSARARAVPFRSRVRGDARRLALDDEPEAMLAKLKKDNSYSNYQRRTVRRVHQRRGEERPEGDARGSLGRGARCGWTRPISPTSRGTTSLFS